MIRRLARLHDDQRGALAPLILFVMLFFAWAITALLNTGQNTYDKVDAQNAADAISIGVTEQAARDLNVMVTNHVASSQTFTIAVVAFALNEVVVQNEARLALAGLLIPVTCTSGIACIGTIPAAEAGIAIFATWLTAIDLQYQPGRGLRTANRVTRALDRMNEHLVRSFPQRASEITAELAARNRVKSVFVYPVCSASNGSDCQTDMRFPGPSLPVSRDEEAAARAEMCWGAYFGSDGVTRLDFRTHGFAFNKGPYTSGGSSGNPHLRDHVNRQSGIGSFLQALDTYLEALKAGFALPPPPRFFTRQKADDNDFTTLVQPNFLSACAGLPPIGLSSALGAEVVMPRNYWLKGRPPIAGFGGTIGAAATLTSFDFTEYGYLHVVARQKSRRSNAEDFVEPEEPFFAYAQSMVFNPLVFDLYSSLWEGELVPAQHMDRPLRVGQAMGNPRVATDFRVLSAILRNSGSSPDWKTVNGH